MLEFWLCLTLLAQFQVFNPILLMTNLAAVLAFIAMESKDTEQHRRHFFYTFSIHIIASFALGMLTLSDRTSDSAIAYRCAEMQKDGGFKEAFYRSMDECKQHQANVVLYAFWIGCILIGLLFLHFSRVVYTHWKRFGQSTETTAHEE